MPTQALLGPVFASLGGQVLGMSVQRGLAGTRPRTGGSQGKTLRQEVIRTKRFLAQAEGIPEFRTVPGIEGTFSFGVQTASDPLTGLPVLGRASQPIELIERLAAEATLREAGRFTDAEIQTLFEAREAFIESRRRPRMLSTMATSSRQPGVTRKLDAGRVTLGAPPTTGLQALAISADPSGPDSISARQAMVRRLSGPCAGPLTGAQRLLCGRGGFA